MSNGLHKMISANFDNIGWVPKTAIGKWDLIDVSIPAKQVRVGRVAICIPLCLSRKHAVTTGESKTYDLFAMTNRSRSGHSKMVFLVEKLGLKGQAITTESFEGGGHAHSHTHTAHSTYQREGP